ncbi:MAG: glycine cleavage system protein GcvH [Candidatus Altiarchaeota archaeon]
MEYNFPEDLLYDSENNWVKIQGEFAVIGITEFAVKKAKEIAYIELPKKGKKFKKGETYSVIEAVKWAGQLKIPLSCEIIEVNENLLDDPTILNNDPYGKGWIAKIKILKKEEVSELMDSEKAKKFFKEK